MNAKLKYMPIFRGRQEEIKVLKTFNFGERIYPCLEIIKELDRAPSPPKPNAKKTAKPKTPKTFESVYLPLIKNIKAKYVFVDIPNHLKPLQTMKIDTLTFLQSIAVKREKRTEYINKLIPLASKVIPVISTFSNITGERGSVGLQEKDLRPNFPIIGFRTFLSTFTQDIVQITSVAKKTDFVIMDWENIELDLTDGDQTDVIEALQKLNCTVIIHRNAIDGNLTNSSLEHAKIVDTIDNSLLVKYKGFGASCFSDYAGIKKDSIGNGGTISPGFVYYDAVKNVFFGYRYAVGGHKKGDVAPVLDEFETTIVPAVLNSGASSRMTKDPLNYLGSENMGWLILNNISSGLEPGKSAPKFKRIGMEHYVHCIKTQINSGVYD